MADVDTLLALMRDPPCMRCKARAAVHQTDELLSRHHFVAPSLPWLADWFEHVSARLASRG